MSFTELDESSKKWFLENHLHYEGLLNGTIKPENDEEKHFIDARQGKKPVLTREEIIFEKYNKDMSQDQNKVKVKKNKKIENEISENEELIPNQERKKKK